MTTAKLSEAELDNAKLSAEKYVESQNEHSDFSDEEKQAMKKGYKLWAEYALQGMKNRLRESGRIKNAIADTTDNGILLIRLCEYGQFQINIQKDKTIFLFTNKW